MAFLKSKIVGSVGRLCESATLLCVSGTSFPSKVAIRTKPLLARSVPPMDDLSPKAIDQRDRPLPVVSFKGKSDEIERQWYEQVYRGRGDSMAQLTWRAVLIGSCLGGVLSLTNLYIGLKAGWGFGVAITASILSYAIWTSLLKVGLARTPMTILENNCMQSTASSAGYSTGGTLISAFAAYIIINDHAMSVPLMLAWVFFIAVLGVTMAIPMKRQMINIEQLRFPSGIAAAETLRALHAKSSQGLRAAKALGFAGLIAAMDKGRPQRHRRGHGVAAGGRHRHLAAGAAAAGRRSNVARNSSGPGRRPDHPPERAGAAGTGRRGWRCADHRLHCQASAVRA